MHGLTPRQKQILVFISEYSRNNGFPPAVRDIGDRFGLNPATVHEHLRALERKGRLRREPGRSRSLVVTGGDVGAPDAATTRVPMVGRVAAGAPILAEENIEDVVHLPANWVPAGGFLLQVQGDSMRDAHILDGDRVLVRPGPTASNGEIVVALIEDEATVKRFYTKGNRVELRPENSAYEPIRIDGEDGIAVSIVGKVVGVFRV